MSSYTPELNKVNLESPTEDGKLAFLQNTLVPRKLDQFDDIKTDLANKNFNTDKAFFYVNFQAGDFCGRSYKLPLSELGTYIKDSLLFGTNGKDPVMVFDKNFQVDSEGLIHLLVDSEGTLLSQKLIDMIARDDAIQADLDLETEERIAEDDVLELKKQDKIVILGSGDELDSEGLPVPKTGTDGYGVHVTYEANEGPVIDKDDNKGYAIKISHEAVVPAGGWISKYAIGGIAIGQGFPEGTKLTDVWKQLLEGDPKNDNVLCCAVASALPQYWTDLPWQQFTVKRNDLVEVTNQSPLTTRSIPFTQWTPINANNQYVMIAIPLTMVHEEGTDIATEKRVRLHEIYTTSHPEFTYSFKHFDIKNSSVASENGYRVYYIDSPITDVIDDLEFEFIYNDPTKPDYED